MISRRSRRSRLPIGTLVLLLAVFGWGLGYKTSLYHPGKHFRAASPNPAKLLTETEREDSGKRAASLHGRAYPPGDGGVQALAGECETAWAAGESQVPAVSQSGGRIWRGFGLSLLRAPPRMCAESFDPQGPREPARRAWARKRLQPRDSAAGCGERLLVERSRFCPI